MQWVGVESWVRGTTTRDEHHPQLSLPPPPPPPVAASIVARQPSSDQRRSASTRAHPLCSLRCLCRHRRHYPKTYYTPTPSTNPSSTTSHRHANRQPSRPHPITLLHPPHAARPGTLRSHPGIRRSPAGVRGALGADARRSRPRHDRTAQLAGGPVYLVVPSEWDRAAHYARGGGTRWWRKAIQTGGGGSESVTSYHGRGTAGCVLRELRRHPVKYVLVERASVTGQGVRLFSRGQRFELSAKERARGGREERNKSGELDPNRTEKARTKAKRLIRARLRRTNRLVDPVIYI